MLSPSHVSLEEQQAHVVTCHYDPQQQQQQQNEKKKREKVET